MSRLVNWLLGPYRRWRKRIWVANLRHNGFSEVQLTFKNDVYNYHKGMVLNGLGTDKEIVAIDADDGIIWIRDYQEQG